MKKEQSEEDNFENNSKMVALVESHCEYLTCIRHNISQRTEVARGSLKTLEDYLSERRGKLNTEALLQLIVQLAYFLYACKTYQVMPEIDSTVDLRVEETSLRGSEKHFSVIIYYRIMRGSMQEGEAMQWFIDIVRFIRERLDDYLNWRKSELEEGAGDLGQESSLYLFCHQLEQLAQNRYFQEHESLFFLCLEQTALFYETSMMYLIKNCSILDFIKTDEGRLGQFRVAKVKDESLVVEFNKEKTSNSDPEALMSKEKEIENNIINFFREINDKHFGQFPPRNEKDQTYRVRFNYTLREREKYAFQEMLQSMQGANVFRNDSKLLMNTKRALSEIDYFIEYSSERNQICVRLYNLNLISNNYTADFLIFQSNVFTYESLNISIELAEPKIKGVDRPKGKVLTFKGTSSFDQKEPPLERMLLLMDVTMIASKIYEPEMMKQVASSSKDYQRLSTISKKIGHYVKLFLKCAKKIYNE